MMPLFLLLKQLGLVNSYGGVDRAGAGEHLRHLPRAPVRAVDSRRPARGRAHRRRRASCGSSSDRRAAAASRSSSRWRSSRFLGTLERLHVAADRADRRGPAHAAGRAREPVARARAGQRADDGGLGGDHAAGAGGVPRAAALLHPGPDAREASRDDGCSCWRPRRAAALRVASGCWAQSWARRRRRLLHKGPHQCRRRRRYACSTASTMSQRGRPWLPTA